MEISLLADNPQESKVIAQWYYDEWAGIAPDMTIGQVHEKVAKAINRDQVPLTVLAHQNNELVGVAELKFRENKNHPEYEHWLGGIFVNPDYRGQGISNLLIKKVKEHAIRLGVECLHLQCESHNVALYKKHGFNVLHEANHCQIKVAIMRWLVNT